MFKLIGISAFLAVALACAPAAAQTAPPAADQGPPPDAAASEAPAAAPGGKPSPKELIASCRAAAKAKGLKGDALKASLDECVGAQRPKLAARLQCRQQGKAQGIADDQLKAFVKTCLAQGSQPSGQGAAAPADQGAPADAAAGEAAAPGGKPSPKELIASCRAAAKAKGLKGDALKASLDECVGAQRPKLAARLQCRQQGKAQGLADDQLKAFVKTCLAQGSQPSGSGAAAPADQGAPADAAAGDQGAPAEAAAAEAPAAAPAGGKTTGKELIASCRADARAKGLSGDALKTAVDECVGAQRPKLAARLQCRQQGKAQGVADEELKAFVKTCLAQRQ